MAGQKPETFEPVTVGHIRSHRCRDLLVYCGSINCNHGITMDADHLPDDTDPTVGAAPILRERACAD